MPASDTITPSLTQVGRRPGTANLPEADVEEQAMAPDWEPGGLRIDLPDPVGGTGRGTRRIAGAARRVGVTVRLHRTSCWGILARAAAAWSPGGRRGRLLPEYRDSYAPVSAIPSPAWRCSRRGGAARCRRQRVSATVLQMTRFQLWRRVATCFENDPPLYRNRVHPI